MGGGRELHCMTGEASFAVWTTGGERAVWEWMMSEVAGWKRTGLNDGERESLYLCVLRIQNSVACSTFLALIGLRQAFPSLFSSSPQSLTLMFDGLRALPEAERKTIRIPHTVHLEAARVRTALQAASRRLNPQRYGVQRPKRSVRT